MKTTTIACLLLALVLAGCSAVTNYRKYEFFLHD